ncbi:MAG TPA: FAD-linked oxidase C-terminal domain-containing protein [Candidatus Saccharimonadales bacterium]|jgi:FAD/FMN-containing dehydrogenase/Fe-S oxidoreductase|nr:FAD-linked oxidase C-terminal domain-containing protein [Candidatus Saccharimonadales bacterium]
MSNTPLPPSSHAKPVDSFAQAAELEAALRRSVRGEVRFDRGSRALYATDGSNYRQIPIGLVVPRDVEDVIAAVAACRKFDAPLLPRGAGTSLAGQCCNVAVVLDSTKYMNHVLEVNPGEKWARVQPGIVLDSLQAALRPHQLIFAPDPSTHNRCTVGGMIGNNSCGAHSLLGGKTVDNVEELKIVLYDGTQMTVGATPAPDLVAIIAQGGRRGKIYGRLQALVNEHSARIRAHYPQIPRRVSGYNLDELLPERGFHVARALVGTEGTCAVVLEAKVKLIHSPQHRVLVVLGYEDGFAAADHVPEVLEFRPIGLEGFEGSIVEGLRRKNAPNLELLPEGGGFLLVEFGSDDPAAAGEQAQRLIAKLKQLPGAPDVRMYTGSEQRLLWQIRESGPRAAAFAPGAPAEWEGWDDAAVPPAKLGAYLRDIRALMNEYRYHGAFYGHFGDGCVHMRVTFDLESEGGIRNYAEFIDRAADLVIGYGGSLSGEHGDGQSRAALLPKMFGPELVGAFREFKAVWDPSQRMNPGKVVDAYPPTENLRLGADYKPMQPLTEFKFPGDDGSFAKATLRCLGLGACRKQEGGMCPSYMVTMEEEHSTRGRAHLLFEMLQGEVLPGGWQNEQVKESLDLCLSCKACKSECPANVDMATWKAEFLSHYYEGRRRPLRAYAFGMIDRWAHLGSLAPGLANLAGHLPGVSHLMRGALGLAPERQLPQLASTTFRQWATRRGTPLAGGRIPAADRAQTQEVILWVDTFNNYFHPETAQAALAVLTHAGFKVKIPAERLCCGRPLYDFGMIGRARQYLLRIIDSLRGPIEAGTPIVVLEPSCASVFRDELGNLFPQDARAERLRRQTFLLSEFLERFAPKYEPPRLEQNVLLHGHCHQKALMKMGHEESLLRRMGAVVQSPDPGCCGMAGPFGFEKEKYAISQAIGERVLLPAVRQASPETLIVCDGFSCREQIVQATGRKAVHLAEAMQMGLEERQGRTTEAQCDVATTKSN